MARRAISIELRYGSDVIPVTVHRRLTSRLSITVNPDQSVVATAPRTGSLESIVSRLRRRSSWILRQRRYFEKFKPLPSVRRYVSGETTLYRGRQYRLKVLRGLTPTVKIQGRYICVTTRSPKLGEARNLLNQWYRDRAHAVLTERFDACVRAAATLNAKAPPLAIRTMSKRWGSCTAAGRVILNPDLIRVPTYCVDYVIFHELCHLKVMRHDAAFATFLERYMPDWRRRKDRLNRFVFATE
jgi:predicted metal-dependent hydrolase